MKVFLAVFVFLLFSAATLSKSQSATCSLCQQIIDSVYDEIEEDLTESNVEISLKALCSSFSLDSWCNKNLMPYLTDVFYALRSDETPKVTCERINMCHFKITSITGDILFAERDRLDRIIPLGDIVQRVEWGKINHPELQEMNITGLSCAPDYCALLLQGSDVYGNSRFGVTALSSSQQIHHQLSTGMWFGPWYDIHTNQFWLATGNSRNITFGIFDTQYGNFIPKIPFHIRTRGHSSNILSGMILNRILYFSLVDDPHVFYLDIATHFYRGNFSSPTNTMLVGNPVTDLLYGYTTSKEGIWRFDNLFQKRTQVANVDLSLVRAVPSSTINPIDNIMWLSLWGLPNEAWMKVDLKKSKENISWAQVGNLEGYFDFNPYDVKSEEA